MKTKKPSAGNTQPNKRQAVVSPAMKAAEAKRAARAAMVGSRVPPMTAPVLAGLALAFNHVRFSELLGSYTAEECANIAAARAWLRATSGQALPVPPHPHSPENMRALCALCGTTGQAHCAGFVRSR